MKVEDINLTSDPLTNIKIMTPYLDEKGRAAVSGLMFGLVLKECMNKESPDSAEGLAMAKHDRETVEKLQKELQEA